LDEKTRNLLIDAISINSSYTSQCIRPEAPNTLVDQLGNKTECGLLGFVLELGQEYELVRNANPECAFHKVYTFNSARKSMSTVIRTDDGYRVFTKGASEIIMSKCKWQLGADGQVRPFSEADQNRLVKEVVESMASDGLRTLCLAYRDYRQCKFFTIV
jgi:magnesium-transporting ATPase (P-type)